MTRWLISTSLLVIVLAFTVRLALGARKSHGFGLAAFTLLVPMAGVYVAFRNGRHADALLLMGAYAAYIGSALY